MYLCDQERECASKEQFCEPEVQTFLDKAPRFTIRWVIGLSTQPIYLQILRRQCCLNSTCIGSDTYWYTTSYCKWRPCSHCKCKCFSNSQNLVPSLISSKKIFPVLPEWRSCPCARGRLLPFQRLLPVATLPRHILSSEGIIIFIFLFPVLQKHHFSECWITPKMSRNVRPETSRRSLETLVARARRSATTRIAPRWLREHRISHFFKAIFPAPPVCVKMCVFEQVRCIVERCDDGSIAPVPEGQCCPSKRACPAQVLVLSDLMI